MKLNYNSIIISWIFSLSCIHQAWAQGDPNIAYAYPAGAAVNSETEISLGGRLLRGAKEVYVTGDGVEAELSSTFSNYSRTYADYLKHFTRIANAKEQGKPIPEAKSDLPKLPDHPAFRELAEMSQAHLQQRNTDLKRESMQKSREMEEIALVKLRIAADAKPGRREIRVSTPFGLSEPFPIYIGSYAEILEKEPNNNSPQIINEPVPFTINGQIKAGDRDQFQFSATAGQQLTIRVDAQVIKPFIADAVPGWFQATIRMLDDNGSELAFADRFEQFPDPVMFFTVPADGNYTIQLQDAIFRGRDDFVYRLTVSDSPFITHQFPLGGKVGESTPVKLAGLNLAETQSLIDGNGAINTPISLGKNHPAGHFYMLNELDEIFKTAAADEAAGQPVNLPVIINGKIDQNQQTSSFQFRGKAGQSIVAEVVARKLGSPLDSFITLTDENGQLIAANDDMDRLNIGLQTHHADSYLCAELPADGSYKITIKDTQNRYGDAFAYRLRISEPMADFELYTTKASVSMRSNGSAAITVKAIRKDGFEGPIDIVLPADEDTFQLSGAQIPAGADEVTFTITDTKFLKNRIAAINLTGKAIVHGKQIRRPCKPTRAMEQAFIRHHLLPSDQLIAYISNWGVNRKTGLKPGEIVQIPINSYKTIVLEPTKKAQSVALTLHKAPDGITFDTKELKDKSIELTISAKDPATVGTKNNLIIEIFHAQKRKDNKQKLVSHGMLPSIPIEVTENR